MMQSEKPLWEESMGFVVRMFPFLFVAMMMAVPLHADSTGLVCNFKAGDLVSADVFQ